MVLPGRDDLTYVLLVKIGSLVLTTLLVMITCLRCVGRIRLRVTAGFWRPDCYKNSRQCREADEVDASNHTSSRNVASVSRSRPLSDFVPFSRISRPPTLERSRSNSEIYAYVGKHQNLGHYWQNVGSNPMQYDMPAYSQILENDGQSSDDLYCQMHGHEFYDNIMDVNSNSERPSKVAANSYDYPKFSPLPLKARPTGADSSEPKQGATDSGCFEPHLYCAIRSISDLHAKPEPSSVPLHRSRLSHSHIGICAEPLYSVIRKQMPFTGRTVYVSRRMLPYSEPSIVQIGVVDASNGPDSSFNPPIEVGPTRERENAEEVFSSNNYRYLSMREPLDVLRRRLEQQDSRNLFNSASDSSLHYYTSINESSDPGYEAVAPSNGGSAGATESAVGRLKGPSSVLRLTVQQSNLESQGSSARNASSSTGIYDNIREANGEALSNQAARLTHSSPECLAEQHWLVLNVGAVTSSSDSDLYTEFDGSRLEKGAQRRSLRDR